MPLAVTTYTDNASNPVSQEDYGLKMSKIGFDALTAADKDLVYSSSWPAMQIVKVVTFDGTSHVFEHGLDFPPFALLLRPTATFTGVMTNLAADEVNVYAPVFDSEPGTIIIYNLDISTDVDYPFTVQEASQSDYDYDYGIKMAKLGADVESTDMRDFILHSRCGSPMILAVKTQETSASENPNVVQYTNAIGYPTLNFGYAKIKDDSTFGSIPYVGTKRYFAAPLQSQAFPQTFTDGTTTYVPFGTVGVDDGATVVVLRNPSFANTNAVSVTY